MNKWYKSWGDVICVILLIFILFGVLMFNNWLLKYKEANSFYKEPIITKMYYTTCSDGYAGVVELWQTGTVETELRDQESGLKIKLGDCTMITIFEVEDK